MAKYIDQDAVLRDWPLCDEPADAYQFIRGFPAADVRPVVRGEWIGYPECLKYPNAYSDDHIVCSACEECFSILDNDCERFNFCPNCGAKMDDGSEDQNWDMANVHTDDCW